MSGLAEWGVSAIAVCATLLLTLGIGATILVANKQVKVHALGLATVGPLLALLAAPIWGDGRTIWVALLVSVFLLLTSAVSGHAIMSLVAEGRGAAEPGHDAQDDPYAQR